MIKSLKNSILSLREHVVKKGDTTHIRSSLPMPPARVPWASLFLEY